MHTPAERKTVGLFAFENIEGINATIGVNPKEYLEVYHDGRVNKKHKGLRRGTKGMDYQMYAGRLRNLTENINIGKNIVKKFTQKRFKTKHGDVSQISLEKVSFGRLNDKCYYFDNGITSLPHGHPDLNAIYDHRKGMKEVDIQKDCKNGREIEKKLLMNIEDY